MKPVPPLYFYFLLWLFPLGTSAQEKVQTLVPHQAIHVGEAFQVQFISTDKALLIQAPDFGNNFELISGPRVYQGSTHRNNIKTTAQNFSYTLVPLRKGRLVVKGATFTYDDKKVKCADAVVIVQPAAKPEQDLLSQVASSPLEQDVFIEAVASKKECFAGEPVVATFTLFSKLSSASEIIKNPGFYGFSVVDMPQATEASESIVHRSGKFYNTHILRKVQLYPVQEGKLVIDEMRVNNTFEEGNALSSTVSYLEKVITSKPVAIRVNPLPRATKDFSGAVGSFLLFAYLITDEWESGKTGRLVVTLSGKGNFLQIAEPHIQWPAGMEVFHGPVTEVLNTDQLPVEGNRKYEYSFTTDSAGSYTIPPIAFTFFNPGEKKYKTVSTGAIPFRVKPAVATAAAIRPQTMHKRKTLPLQMMVLAVLTLAGVYLFRSKKNAATDPACPAVQTTAEKMSMVPANDYRQLQQLFQEFLKKRYGIVHFSRTQGRMQLSGIMNRRQQESFLELWEECERVLYYQALPGKSFETLKVRSVALVKELE